MTFALHVESRIRECAAFFVRRMNEGDFGPHCVDAIRLGGRQGRALAASLHRLEKDGIIERVKGGYRVTTRAIIELRALLAFIEDETFDATAHHERCGQH